MSRANNRTKPGPSWTTDCDLRRWHTYGSRSRPLTSSPWTTARPRSTRWAITRSTAQPALSHGLGLLDGLHKDGAFVAHVRARLRPMGSWLLVDRIRSGSSVAAVGIPRAAMSPAASGGRTAEPVTEEDV